MCRHSARGRFYPLANPGKREEAGVKERAITAPSPEQVTRLLKAWSLGQDPALEELVPLVHQELRRIAHRYLYGERGCHTLQTTALVNETYLRLGKAWRAREMGRTAGAKDDA